MFKHNLGKEYSPLYFLAALGPGGLAVSFFMYLMFLLPHQGYPMPALMHWLPAVQQGGLISIGVLLVIGIFIFLMAAHLILLKWNLKELSIYKQTQAYQELTNSNGEVSLMAVPLTLAMTINVLFIVGSLFVPGIWSVIQYLFPFALLAFAWIGFWSLRIYGRYLMRLLLKGNFDQENNNSWAQLLAPFTFAMVAVGLAAPGAMSHHVVISGLSLALSLLFVSLTVLLTVFWLFMGLKQMVTKGLDTKAAPTLWILIPILTLLGISFVRQTMGLHHNFDATLDNSMFLQLMSLMFGLQLVIGLFGYAVMKRIGYFQTFIHGPEQSPATFGLICPGVALVVFGFFYIHYGFVLNGVVDKYSLTHWLILLPLVWVQVVTTITMLKLSYKQLINKKFNEAEVTYS